MKRFFILIPFFIGSLSLCAQTWTGVSATYDGTYNADNYKRHECGAVACEINGQPFGVVIGGRGSGDKRRPVFYDVANNHLHLGAQCPVELNHFQAVVWRDSFIVVGMALTGGYPDETPYANIYLYNTRANTWTNYDPIPVGRRRGSTQAVIDGDWVYFFNGLTQGHKNGWQNQVDRYNLATKTWETRANSPRARDHAVAVKDGNLVYIIGGRRSNAGGTWGVHGDPKLEVDVYNLATDTWTTLPGAANLPNARAGHMAALQFNTSGHKQINVWGGEHGGGTRNTGEGLDLVTETWNPLPNMLSSLHGSQIIQFNADSILLLAGATSGGNEKAVTVAHYTQQFYSSPVFPTEPVWSELIATRQSGLEIGLSWTFEGWEEPATFEVDWREGNSAWEPTGASLDGFSTSTFSLTLPARELAEGLDLRIRALSADGRVSVSPTIRLIEQSYWTLFPNPVPAGSQDLFFSQEVDAARLYNSTGQVLVDQGRSQQLALPKGLAAGIYWVETRQQGQYRKAAVLIR